MKPSPQLALFELPEGPGIEQLAERAINLIRTVAAKGHPLVAAWSGGKDSSTVLNLSLVALKQLVDSGAAAPQLIVLHADTLVENPEMAAYAYSEMNRIREYARQHNLPVQIEISKPALLAQWPVKVVSGRNLPVFANKGSRDCTMDLKVMPMGKVKNRIMRNLTRTVNAAPVTILGTRFAESPGRKARMLERGENAEDLWSDKEGLKLSPVANWSDADLWQYLYACANGELESYGTFSGLIDLYTDGASSIETLSNGIDVPSCRFGCAICTVGRDRSMEAMLAKGGKYSYMQPLYDLQRFLVNTQYDLDRRQWVGRSIKEGYIAIAPDTYSPEMLEELLRIILTIDVREKETAYALDIEPRFELISAQALIAIDAIWSQQGIHPSFHGLAIYRDIYVDGKRYDIPITTPGSPVEIPPPKYLYVGEGWLVEHGLEYSGLRDVFVETFSEGNGCMGTKTLTDGRVVLDGEVSDGEFTVDCEASGLILGLELDYLINLSSSVPRNYGFKHYTTLGALKFAKSQFGTTDTIMRRTAFKEYEGIFDMSREELLAKAIDQLPGDVTENTLKILPFVKPDVIGDLFDLP